MCKLISSMEMLHISPIMLANYASSQIYARMFDGGPSRFVLTTYRAVLLIGNKTLLICATLQHSCARLSFGEKK